LSTPDYPKHLLTVNGGAKSLVQNTYERAKLTSDKVFVITDSSHAHHVKKQLPELPEDSFIIEPARRGTASCIVAGLERISRVSMDEPVAFIAADHYIRDSKGFAHSFKVAAEASIKQGKIVLVGVEPDHAATGFGYIEKGDLEDEGNFVFSVKEFKEKPDYKLAQQYLRSGNYLWNCGYFVGSVETFLKVMKKFASNLAEDYQLLCGAKTPEDYKRVYLGFENISIDYALIERVNDLLVVQATFDWMDVGSYSDLHKAVVSDEKGNHMHGEIEVEDVQNSFVQNYDNKPVAVIGLDNVVVVNTKHGLVVARKDMSQAIGDVAKRIHSKER
ncbi:mannose-1-phosphate guanylyltransferase, partial [Candidatus Saccharibacteria bacterium]|nr:mannose-1-phosphate guanylyltransferase [Candidatus Saccharibacteria bacterium]